MLPRVSGGFYASENSLISRRARGVEFNRGNLSFSAHREYKRRTYFRRSAKERRGSLFFSSLSIFPIFFSFCETDLTCYRLPRDHTHPSDTNSWVRFCFENFAIAIQSRCCLLRSRALLSRVEISRSTFDLNLAKNARKSHT